tara:strand:- start:170 stop:370 length:201 start_codon:yes stop_codon:yes gene_type:complete
MGKIPYLLAGLLASITLLINLLMQSNSLAFSFFRAAFVMIGVLFIFFSAGLLMRWGAYLMFPRKKN